MVNEQAPERAEWVEERLRYRILRSVYQRAGAHCATCVAAGDIAADLNLAREALRAAMERLEESKYLFTVGPGPMVCITPKGIRYIEQAAGRRKSVRIPAYL